MEDVCIVCGEPVHRVVMRDGEAVDDIEPGAKIHLMCLLEPRGQGMLRQMAQEVVGDEAGESGS